MNDLISRQAAIDAIRKGYPDVINSDYKDGLRIGTDRAIYHVEHMPSAQPEIVKCKDCKHYGCILYSGTQFEYGECFGHEESDYIFEVKPDDYCSRAERRTDDR